MGQPKYRIERRDCFRVAKWLQTNKKLLSPSADGKIPALSRDAFAELAAEELKLPRVKWAHIYRIAEEAGITLPNSKSNGSYAKKVPTNNMRFLAKQLLLLIDFMSDELLPPLTVQLDIDNLGKLARGESIDVVNTGTDNVNSEI